jgi:chromosome segregation ATPase
MGKKNEKIEKLEFTIAEKRKKIEKLDYKIEKLEEKLHFEKKENSDLLQETIKLTSEKQEIEERFSGYAFFIAKLNESENFLQARKEILVSLINTPKSNLISNKELAKEVKKWLKVK